MSIAVKSAVGKTRQRLFAINIIVNLTIHSFLFPALFRHQQPAGSLFARHLFVTVGGHSCFGLELIMAAAVLTPRIRLMPICDGVRESRTEAGVYHMKGLRQRIVAPSFPFAPPRLWLFLVFSSTRPGVFPGCVLVIDDQTDKAIFYRPLTPPPRFEANDETLGGFARLRCSFPHGGRYTIQFWFYQEHGSDVLKGEIPCSVEQEGE